MSPAQKEQYESARKARDEEVARLAAHEAENERWRASPEYLIQRLREEAEEARVKRENAERQKEMDLALIMAQKEHGADKVAGVLTLRGPILLRAPTGEESDAHDLRLAKLPPDDHEPVWRDYLADHVIYPPNRDAYQRIVDEFPGTRPLLSSLLSTLSSAAREATAKKG